MLANPRHRLGIALRAFLVALPLAAQVSAVWPFTVDDSYITLRYARNLAAGLGPVFQPGLARAEGCTTVLWMVMLALPHALHVDALLTAKWLGVAATVATLLMAARLAHRGSASLGPVAAVGAGCFAAFGPACFPPTAVHAVSGMETALFGMLMIAVATAAHAAIETRPAGWAERLSLVCLALGLTRPEGNLVAGSALLTALVMLPLAERGTLARRIAGLYLLPAAIYFAWRWSYYGQPLPLPFYVKIASATSLPGAFRVLGFVETLALPAGLGTALALARLPRGLRPTAAAAATLMVFGLFPTHLMGYQFRYLAPAAPLLFVLAAHGLARAAVIVARRTPSRSATVWLAATGIAALLAASALTDAPRVVADRLLYARGLSAAHVALGRRLAELPPGSIAIEDAGAVPYLSDWHTVDLGGLNDVHIARTGDRSPAYVLAGSPDLVVLNATSHDALAPSRRVAWESALLAACLDSGMTRVAAYEFHPGYWLWVMARPDGRYARAFDGIGNATPAGAALKATPAAPPSGTRDRRPA